MLQRCSFLVRSNHSKSFRSNVQGTEVISSHCEPIAPGPLEQVSPLQVEVRLLLTVTVRYCLFLWKHTLLAGWTMPIRAVATAYRRRLKAACPG